MSSQLAGDRPRGRWRLAAAAVALVPLVAGVAIWASPSGRLKAGRFPELRPGMTRAEVEGLLGGPAGDYGDHADGIAESGDGSVLQAFSAPGAGPAVAQTWQDDRNRFFVFFDGAGRVVAASRANHFRRRPRGGMLAKIRDTLRSILD